MSTSAGSEASGTGVLLDSVILIDHLNGIVAATTYLATIGERASISVITRVEVLAGYDPGATATVKLWLDRFQLHAIDKAAADLAGNLRRQHGFRLPDALQAAVAQLQGLKLVTRNTKDFPPRRFPFVEVPYRLP